MRPYRPMRSLLGLMAVLLGCPFLLSGPPREGKKEPADPPKRPVALTYEEAVEQLTLSPDNPYLQYVALQLGRREGKLEEAVRQVESIVGLPPRPDDRSRAELFNMFTGGLAVQES